MLPCACLTQLDQDKDKVNPLLQTTNVTPSSEHQHHRRYGMLIAHPHPSLPYTNIFQGKRKTAAKPAGPKKVCDCRKANTPQDMPQQRVAQRYAADIDHSATASTQSSNVSSVIVKTQSRPRSTRRPVLQVFLARTACRATRCPPTVCRSTYPNKLLENRAPC
jgi:hypothetical protein